MKVENAIKERIKEIAKQTDKAINTICLAGGLPPNTLYDSMRGETKAPSVKTLKRFCEGAGITLSEFFSRDYFNDFEED